MNGQVAKVPKITYCPRNSMRSLLMLKLSLTTVKTQKMEKAFSWELWLAKSEDKKKSR